MVDRSGSTGNVLWSRYWLIISCTLDCYPTETQQSTSGNLPDRVLRQARSIWRPLSLIVHAPNYIHSIYMGLPCKAHANDGTTTTNDSGIHGSDLVIKIHATLTCNCDLRTYTQTGKTTRLMDHKISQVHSHSDTGAGSHDRYSERQPPDL